MDVYAPHVTPERLYLQDKRRREWDTKERSISRVVAQHERRFGQYNPFEAKTKSPEIENLCSGLRELQRYFTSSRSV